MPTVIDAIAQVLRAEGVEFLSAYPTTGVIDAAVRAGIRPVVCRQERVGVGLADGFSRVTTDSGFGVFACQYGPGIENAFSGIASAHSDGVPILVLPTGNPLRRAQVPPVFRACSAFEPVTKSFETISRPDDVLETMRRAVNAVRNGPPGPVVVEIPLDVGPAEVPEELPAYKPVSSVKSAAVAEDVERALEALLTAEAPVLLAGQGVLRARASDELVELAELLGIPVLTTLAGKSAMPERHSLSVGTASSVASDVVVEFWRAADAVLAVGTSLADHWIAPKVGADTKLIHVTISARDLNKSRHVDHPLLGDAKVILRQFAEAARSTKAGGRHERRELTERIAAGKRRWLEKWQHKLGSDEVPINPYRALYEFMQVIDPADAIVTHDSGSPRDQLAPLYVAADPNSYIGWGKSHALGSGLGLALGAKIAAPEKLVVHFQGDAAFGMTGLDIETAARCSIPILSVVLNNSTMAIETSHLVESHERYGTRDIGGDYAGLARTLGVEAMRVEDPAKLAEAYRWGARTTADGRAALIEVITSAETEFANRAAISGPPR